MCDVFTQHYVFIKDWIPLCPPFSIAGSQTQPPTWQKCHTPKHLLSSSCLHPQIVSVPAGAATPAGEARESPWVPGEEEAAICWPCGRNKQLLPPGRGEGVGSVPFHNGAYRRKVTCRLTGLRSSGDKADNHAAGSRT